MSCLANKTAAITDFGSQSFSSGVSPIQVFEKTESTNNKATVSVTKGTLKKDLTFTSGTYGQTFSGNGRIFLKIDPQTDGYSDTGINTPPVTTATPSAFYQDSNQTVTLNQDFTSTPYADVTPAFSSGNTCGASTTIKGWQVSDAQIIMDRTPLHLAYARFS